MNALKKDHGFPTIGDDQQARLLVMSSENKVEIGSLLGGMMIETPGHTPDSVSLLLEDGTLLCGDTLMNGYPSQHYIPILAEDKDALIASWQLLIQMHPKLVLPGHGKPFCGKAVSDNLQHLKAMRLRTLYTK